MAFSKLKLMVLGYPSFNPFHKLPIALYIILSHSFINHNLWANKHHLVSGATFPLRLGPVEWNFPRVLGAAIRHFFVIYFVFLVFYFEKLLKIGVSCSCNYDWQEFIGSYFCKSFRSVLPVLAHYILLLVRYANLNRWHFSADGGQFVSDIYGDVLGKFDCRMISEWK